MSFSTASAALVDSARSTMPVAIGAQSRTISGRATAQASTDRPGTIKGTPIGISTTVPTAATSMKAAV
jgi:hypothetical protein